MGEDIAKMSLGLSISVRDRSGKLLKKVFDPLIYRGDILPCTRSRSYRTTKQNQTSVSVKVYGGERPLIEDNLQLGNFLVEKIPKNDIGKEKVDITFCLDKDLKLHIDLKVKSTGKEERRVIETALVQEDMKKFNRLYKQEGL